MTQVTFSPAALQRAREQWGHTQLQAAIRMRTALSTIQFWERGAKKPTGLYLDRVLDYIAGGPEAQRGGNP